MKKKWLWVAIGGVLVIVLVMANMARSSGGKVESVQLARVRVEDVTSRVKAPGKIEPKTQVKISADVPGKVIRLAVEEGDQVRRGQLLLQLEDTQYRVTWNQTRHRLQLIADRFHSYNSSTGDGSSPSRAASIISRACFGMSMPYSSNLRSAQRPIWRGSL
jgi:multidrug efflux pump subunit AcrA (membrane-fusion protein)